MFKKTFAIIALIGLAFSATVSTASARSNGYKADNHKQSGYKNKKSKHQKQGWSQHKRGKHQKFNVGVRYGVPIHRIRHQLRYRGFYKIRFIDRYLPRYKAIACKNGKRFKMRINRWGEIMRRRQIGWCGYRHYNY